MINRRPSCSSHSERAPRSSAPLPVVVLASLALALLLFLLPCTPALGAPAQAPAPGFLPPPPSRRAPPMDGLQAPTHGTRRPLMAPSPILRLKEDALVEGRRLVVAAAAAAGGPEGEPQRGLNWGAPSVTAGSSTVAAQHLQQQQQQQQQQPGGAPASSASVSTAEVMSLDSVRSTLIRQEDSIIFALIERAQFRRNEAIYARGILQLDPTVPEFDFLKTLSFLEYLLLETERLHGKVRRYTSPEEHAFFPANIPQPILAPLQFPSLLAPNTVDVNPQILALYIDEIVPAVCKAGDDEQHGSSVLADITLLQAISKRIHLGKFVAETKFQETEEKYRSLVLADDVDGVMELLTNRAVEERVLQRAKLKASTYGQDITGQTAAFKVEPSVIAAIYRDIIIPLTKDVEVLYLFERVGRAPPYPLPSQRYRLRLEEKI